MVRSATVARHVKAWVCFVVVGCFSDPPPVPEDGSDTTNGVETTSDPSTTGSPSTSTTTTNDASASAESESACSPQVFTDIEIPLQPVNLYMIVLSDADETRLDSAMPSLLDGLLGPDGEELRFVFADDGTATPPVSAEYFCASCEESCESALRYTATGTSVFDEFLTTAASLMFTCVIHPQATVPRGRLLVVAGPFASDLTQPQVDTLELLLGEEEADGELLCSGCAPDGDSPAEKLITDEGGYVSDLEDPEQVTQALLRAALAPPRCVWPIREDVEPPLGHADMTVRIDACVDPSCAVDLEQVTGAGACDGDPVIPQFYVVPDLFAPGVSAVTLCPAACRPFRRAAHAFTRVEHIYNCPE